MIIEDPTNGMHNLILTERESNIHISVEYTRTQRH